MKQKLSSSDISMSNYKKDSWVRFPDQVLLTKRWTWEWHTYDNLMSSQCKCSTNTGYFFDLNEKRMLHANKTIPSSHEGLDDIK